MKYNRLDKKELDKCTRHIYVPWPYVQDYQQYDDYEDHSVPDFDSADGGGAFIEEDWLYDHTPDNEKSSCKDLRKWENEFDKYFDISDLEDDEIVPPIWEAKHQFILEMQSGEVSSVEEFVRKYNLDN